MFAQLITENIPQIFLLATGASFVQRTTGFGFGIFIMTLLPFLMPSYGEATALSGLLAFTTSLIAAIKYRKFITWGRFLPILSVFLITSTIAIHLLKGMQDGAIRFILGFILIFVSIWFAFLNKRIKFKTTLPYQLGAGSVSGLMGGFFGMHGPPAVLYFISAEADKEHYMGMIQTYFVITNAMMTIARAYNGFVTPTVGKCYIFCLGAVAIGSALGAWAFSRIPGKKFPYVVYGYIGISGLIILCSAL
ncbi:MAG: sulfite exporter TauE/SafE family protein [Bacteroidales bacterium]|nr:sulfite exporter TauE/SafE family protein [Bacteroidales bacterium]